MTQRGIENMVNLEELVKQSFLVTITKVNEMTLDEHLDKHGTPEQKGAFIDAIKRYPPNIITKEEKEAYKLDRMKRKGLTIYYKLPDGSERFEHFLIPKGSGYKSSNLKAIMEKNSLPFNTADWIGKNVKGTYNESGFVILER